MDDIQKATMFAGLTDREMTEAVVYEMRRRGLYGIVFMFPATGGASVMGSSSPPGSMRGLPAAAQLVFFAECAALATGEQAQALPDEPEDPKTWIN